MILLSRPRRTIPIVANLFQNHDRLHICDTFGTWRVGAAKGDSGISEDSLAILGNVTLEMLVIYKVALNRHLGCCEVGKPVGTEMSKKEILTPSLKRACASIQRLFKV